MKKSYRELLEATGIIAVILSLLFVAWQIQQANRIAVVSNEIEIRNSFGSMNEAVMTDSDLIDLLVKASDADYQLTPHEIQRASSWRNRAMNVWLAAETAHANGILPQASFDLVLDDIEAVLLSYPALAPLFRRTLEAYPAFSESEVYSLLDRQLRANEM